MPNLSPYAAQASDKSLIKSPLPSFQGEFLTECSVVFVGHRQKPSWCFAVIMMPFIPASLATCAHCLASSVEGLNCSGDSPPVPHSMFVNVFILKWMKP